MRLLVCGGAGFIGSNFVRSRVREHGDEVVVLDKLTYAGRTENLHDVIDEPRLRFVHGAIEDPDAVAEAVGGAQAIVNFAAESHVDRSIAEPDAFVRTSALGTYVLLEAARERGLRYVQVSTDEVYYVHTYGLNASICRGANNYGAYQHPEKLIPLMILCALHGDRLPVYGDGMQVRNWLYVEDFGAAISRVLSAGASGEVYNVGGPDECPNLEVVRRIIELTGADPALVEHVRDRPGHDRRYSLSSEKVSSLGWQPRVRLREGLERTVAWYRENAWWWEPIRSGEYRQYYARQYGRVLAGE
jgi:dTDP-glucose 4,6-dehydratase